jgi:hypothetical protein
MVDLDHFEDEQCTVSLHDDIVVIDLRDAMRAEHVEFVDRLTERVGGERAASVSVLVRVAAGAAFPTIEARQAFIAFLRDNRTRVRSIHAVLDGRGFWAASMSALAATIARAVPFGPKIHVHATVEEATAELFSHFDGERISEVDRHALASAFQRAS